MAIVLDAILQRLHAQPTPFDLFLWFTVLGWPDFAVAVAAVSSVAVAKAGVAYVARRTVVRLRRWWRLRRSQRAAP